MLKNITPYILIFSAIIGYAQPKQTYLDSIKATFVNDETSSCIDERWMKELTNQDLFEGMQNDILEINIDETVAFNELSTDLLKKRLKLLDEKSVFNIAYNPALENVIKSFLKNRSKSYERLMALSEYYFPLFEDHLAKYNVPLEIKYLAIVESALNPRARSRVGASGLWQFMLYTGKQYGLEVNSYVDERFDPIKASEAACRYLSDLHGMLGDWDLVLAAYNSGPGNVSKAIRRSGGQANYWNIRRNLPRETQGYLPAFLATMYVYEYRKEHNINPKKAPLTYFETDTVMVKRKMSFRQISDLLDIPVEQIQFLNPIYKLDIIPFVSDKPHFLRLPKNKIGVFASNERKIYAYLDFVEQLREKPLFAAERDSISVDETRVVVKNIYHKVKRGESLGKIADKYNVSVSELKKWNKIKGTKVAKGQRLRIETKKAVAFQTKSTTANVPENQVIDTLKLEQPTSPNDAQNFVLHTVKKKETLSSIAKKYGVTSANIKEWNSLKSSNLNYGKKLKIYSNQTPKTVEVSKNSEPKEITHTVKKGEYLIKIAEMYNVSVEDIMTWNKLTERGVSAGTKLIIKTTKAPSKTVSDEEEEKKIHIVKKGESLGRIASNYGVTVGQLSEWNDLPDTNIKEGQELVIKNTEKPTKSKSNTTTKTHTVISGDTLSELADRYEVSVSDIRKWNNLKGSSLKVGMKLVVKK